MSHELEDDDDREPDEGDEPSLGSFNRMVDQSKAWRTQVIAIYVAIRLLRLARYCFRAGRFFANLGARLHGL